MVDGMEVEASPLQSSSEHPSPALSAASSSNEPTPLLLDSNAEVVPTPMSHGDTDERAGVDSDIKDMLP